MKGSRIAILGYGRFGRALAHLCLDRELEVAAFDPKSDVPPALRVPSIARLLERAESVVLAVPVPEMEAVLAEILPELSSRALVLDVGSVKSGPVESMRRILGSRIPWIGTHPLFGPTSLALGERPLRVVICPNDLHPDATARARAFYEHLGCEVIEQDPDAHDRAMADTHVLAFFVAKGLLDAGAGEGVSFAPPSFQAIARTVEAVRSDAGHLFLAIQRENPHAGAARRRLIDALSSIDEQLARSGALPVHAVPSFSIPDLGSGSPDLRETRELIDEVDLEIVELLGRRAELSRRAGRAKAEQGQAVRDPERERVLLADRAAWAKVRGLDPEAVRDVFDSILRLSRTVQRK